MKPNFFGTVSSGTTRPEDLIPVFYDLLRTLRGSAPRAIYDEWRTWNADSYDGDKDDVAHELLGQLFDALGQYAAPYMYFGAHPGDGSDYGFWLSESTADDVRDSGGLVISDTSEVPDDYVGEVLHVNERGNTTLYTCKRGGKLKEVWALV